MMILHHAWRSSASRRVRLCLEEKGLGYESHIVDMAKMEHHSPEYLKINPLGVIPTLIHDGKPLHESGTICEYLDESFPEPPLRPGRRLRARRDAQLDPAHRRADRQSDHLQLASPSAEGRVAMVGRGTRRAAEEHPEQGAAGSLAARGAQALHRGGARRRAREAGRSCSARWKTALKPAGWLVGQAYSIADIAPCRS